MTLPREFFAQDTLTVARNLLGKTLVRDYKGHYLRAKIVETEAYLGQSDSASHSFKGLTPRTKVMFGPPGFAYVYFIYGMYYMFNVVTEDVETGSAVLVRAVEPLAGQIQMQTLRGGKEKDIANGPAKLCQALAIDKRLNGWDLTLGRKLWLEDGIEIEAAMISSGPRIRINYAAPEDQQAPRRFWISRNGHVSKP